MVTLKETITNIKADFSRRLLLENKQHGFFNQLSVLVKPGMISVIMYRLSRFCIHNKLGLLYHFFVIIEHIYCRNEVSPKADLGAGLVLDGIGIGIPCATTTGQNCTFLGRCTLTLGGMEGYSLEKNRFVIGNHCVFGEGARIVRPVTLEDGAQIMQNSVVMLSEPKQGSTISGIPARRRRTDDLEAIKKWNPLSGQLLVSES